MTDNIEIKRWCTKPDKQATYINAKVFINPNISRDALKLYGVLFNLAKKDNNSLYAVRTTCDLSHEELTKATAKLSMCGVLYIHGNTYYLGDGFGIKAFNVAVSYGLTPDEIEAERVACQERMREERTVK